MKYCFLAAMMVICSCGFAQLPVLTDDLNTGIDTIVRKYILFRKDQVVDYYWLDDSNYKLEPVQFSEKIEQARKDAYHRIKAGNREETTLKQLDIDYYLRKLLLHYKPYYLFRKMAFAKRQKIAYSIKQNDSLSKNIDSLIYPNTDLNNEALYKRSATYRDWVEDYLNELYRTKYNSDTTFGKIYIKDAVPISVVLAEIQNSFIRDYECYQNAIDIIKQTKDSGLITKTYQDFNTAITNPYCRAEMQQVYDNYKRLQTTGTAAPDFTYTAVDGKSITLSKLRGKYVYIDIWATYCVPCKEQIPFLAKLEEDYKDKNIRFVSISVDKQAQAVAWRRYVTDNKLTGYQVMADKDFKSDFIEKFNIAMIPRFILIDPEGNVVDSDGKRPSDPAVKKQLDELLK